MTSYPHHYSGGQGNGGQQQQQPWQDGATDDEDRWTDKEVKYASNLLSATVATASVTRRGVERHTRLPSRSEEMQSRKATTPSRWLWVNILLPDCL